jgi:hypothetical protein
VKAEITYNAGASYRFVGIPGPIVKFRQNKTQTVTDSQLIKAAQNTKGFTVRILEAERPPKKQRRTKKKRTMRETVARTTKKKTKKKTRRYSE